MPIKEIMEYLKTASVVPSSSDPLFEKAIELSKDAFAKTFDAATRSLGGFSVVAPTRQQVVVVPDSIQKK